MIQNLRREGKKNRQKDTETNFVVYIVNNELQDW